MDAGPPDGKRGRGIAVPDPRGGRPSCKPPPGGASRPSPSPPIHSPDGPHPIEPLQTAWRPVMSILPILILPIPLDTQTVVGDRHPVRLTSLRSLALLSRLRGSGLRTVLPIIACAARARDAPPWRSAPVVSVAPSDVSQLARTSSEPKSVLQPAKRRLRSSDDDLDRPGICRWCSPVGRPSAPLRLRSSLSPPPSPSRGNGYRQRAWRLPWSLHPKVQRVRAVSWPRTQPAWSRDGTVAFADGCKVMNDISYTIPEMIERVRTGSVKVALYSAAAIALISLGHAL